VFHGWLVYFQGCEVLIWFFDIYNLGLNWRKVFKEKFIHESSEGFAQETNNHPTRYTRSHKPVGMFDTIMAITNQMNLEWTNCFIFLHSVVNQEDISKAIDFRGIRMIIAGPPGSGKSALTHFYCNEEFKPTSPTIW
jgi:Cdc6-like AAA superfamily ATPase